MHKNLPNILSISRMLIVPLIGGLMFFDNIAVSRFAAFLFILASITDFLDGYFARKLKVQTEIGRILDPIADKVLVVSILIIALFQQKADLLPTLAIVIREIIVAGLRELVGAKKQVVKVLYLAKFKTFSQMVALTLILLNKEDIFYINTNLLGNLLLWISAALTVITGVMYFKNFLKKNNG